jgi:hypothetical protein
MHKYYAYFNEFKYKDTLSLRDVSELSKTAGERSAGMLRVAAALTNGDSREAKISDPKMTPVIMFETFIDTP